MIISINKSSSSAIYLQVYNAIRNQILQREIKYGTRLPSERKLAEHLNINRSTVITAYDLLKADGFIQSFPGKGTFVVFNLDTDKTESLPVTHYDWNHTFESKQSNHQNSVIRLIMDADSRSGKYFFAGGLPDDRLIPNETFQEFGAALLRDPSLNVLAHSAVSGVDVLKKQIKHMMELQGIHSSVKEHLIASGSQQALDLVFRTFVNEGDAVLVEEPTFFGALQLLNHYGAKVISVTMDQDGMQSEILEYMIQTHSPKFIYTIPTYQNPTGTTMSLERREKLMELANAYNVPIIEDDPYSMISYEQESLPSLKSLDRSNHVIYISTFSKTVALGVRIGWIIAAEEVIRCLSEAKQISDLHVNSLNQYIMASFLESPKYLNHVAHVTKIYRQKRDLMIQTLKEAFGQDIQFDIPKGGFNIWVTFKSDISMRALFEEGLKQGVVITPGYHFMVDGRDSLPQMRLNFTYPTKEEIVKGIHLLAGCYQKIRKDG